MEYNTRKTGLAEFHLQKVEKQSQCCICMETINAGDMRGISKTGTVCCVLCLEQWCRVGGYLREIPRYALRVMKNGFITKI